MALEGFMRRKWLSFPIVIVCFGLIALFFNILPKETAPYDDRSLVIVSVTTPEGATFDYTDRFMEDMSKLMNDSIPEKKIALVITSPGFLSSSVNTGRIRLALKNPEDRERSQKEIADDFTKWTKNTPKPKSPFRNNQP